VRTFRFAGSCTPYPLLNAFALEVLRQNLQLTYTSFAHIRGAEQADFNAIRLSGCRALFFGIESGSQRILDAMRKGIKTQMIPEALRKARAAGIFTVGSLIYPAPGDTSETASETIELLCQERPDALAIQAPIVIPRTDWCESPEKYGIVYPKGREYYLDQGLSWKLNLILPPTFWRDLPIRINAMTYKAVLRETAKFVHLAQTKGFLTSVSDDTFLMSDRAGMDVPAFKDQSRTAFFAGDIPAVRNLVERVNARV